MLTPLRIGLLTAFRCAPVALFFATALPALGQTFTVSSPDSQITATIKIVSGNLFYNLARSGQSVVDDSRLGLILDNGGAEDLGAGVALLTASSVTAVNQTYATLGWHPTAVNNYNSRTFSITKAGGNNDSGIEFRVFNDGLAFRYTLPTETSSGPRTVLGEATQWKLPTTTNSGWYQQGSNGDYANTWSNAPISVPSGTDLDGEDRLMGPVVINYGSGGYAAITESDYWGYSGMTYKGSGAGTRAIQAAFIRDTTGWQEPSGSTSPWRTIVTSPNLNGLVNSDMITNVARSPDPTLYPNGVDTSWITTGRSLWSFLDVNHSERTEVNMKAYIDKAQQLGFEYVTVDAGWEARPWWWVDNSGTGKTGWKADGTTGGTDNNASFAALADLVAYAHARGIKIIAWKDSDDFYHAPLPTDPQPNDFSVSQMQTFLDKLQAIGVDGVKMDFLRQQPPGVPTVHLVGEYQRLLNFMATTYQDAAARQMVLDFHGAPKDAGANRSFPNGLTTEDVRGLESGAIPSHDATLPFTTLLSGPTDYTPGLFSPDSKPGKRNLIQGTPPVTVDTTTWSHQMAMGVLITSPIIHWASGPDTLNAALPDGSPELEVFKSITATWDETRVLDISQIGTLAAFARRDGNNWFLAMVSGDATNPMSLNNIDLSFLGTGTYDATFVADDLLHDDKFNVTTVDSLNRFFDLDVTMRQGGGFVAMFTLVPEPSTFALFGVAMAALLWHCRLRFSRVG